ncbi:MAG: cation:proton antiporter [Candidatus Diapherotrites archaeon]|nr:cation:proton antiporter [Candidatus Diapherotrites archaeon]
MADVIIPLVLIGAVMLLGFFGEYIFKRTAIPNVIWLLFFGLALGPLFNVVDPSLFMQVSEMFAAVAIIIILFDGGLNMNLYKVIREAPRGTLLALCAFLMSLLVTAVVVVASGESVLNGVLLGAIVGGVSSPIVIPLVARIPGVGDDTKIVLSIESAVTDVLCIVVTIAIIQTVITGMAPFDAAKSVAGAFSIGAMLGLVVGLAWLPALRHLIREQYAYVVTFSMLFLIYACAEALGGSGAFACLMFGLVLGNGKAISTMLKYQKVEFGLDETTKNFHSLVTFFIRTFFFVYMGILVTIGEFYYLLMGIVISAGILALRPLAAKVASYGKQLDIKVMTVMVPRGLAAAVLASLPFSMGLAGTAWFADVVFTVILSTAIISTVGVFVVSRQRPKVKNVAKEGIKEVKLAEEEE